MSGTFYPCACCNVDAHRIPVDPPDILDIAVGHLANDDYNHVPEATLRERLEQIRRTRTETRLWDQADVFIAAVRDELTGWDPTDVAYGPHDEDCATRCEINHRLGGKCRTLHHCDVCNPPQPLDGIGMGVIARSLGVF